MIRGVATWKRAAQGPAVSIRLAEKTLEITHAELGTHDTVEKLKQELERQADEALPGVFVHINRDGSLAVATGSAPEVWPEDEPEDVDLGK